MQFITFLGPIGATFSHDAYNLLAKRYKAPDVLDVTEAYYMPASKNAEIPEKVCNIRGYGAIAMETKAEARVAESLEGFIKLLGTYDRLELPGHGDGCPIHIIGSIMMPLHFCLMVHPEADLEALIKVFGHAKAFGACRKRIEASQLQTVEVASNGEGARRIAEDATYSNYAALGPRSAANKYGLRVLDESYEDDPAVTTFFLLAPRMRKVSIGDTNRVLIVFRLEHQPGSLVKALQPFATLNLIQIHSVHTGNHAYDFAIELDVDASSLPAFHAAHATFSTCVERHLTFGPFEVYSP